MQACKPCPYRLFNTHEGQSMCMTCLNSGICSLNEFGTIDKIDILAYSSIQPDLLKYETNTVPQQSMNLHILISVLRSQRLAGLS